eukprot:4408744-Pyramimonas_sp.AAC.1
MSGDGWDILAFSGITLTVIGDLSDSRQSPDRVPTDPRQNPDKIPDRFPTRFPSESRQDSRQIPVRVPSESR